MPISECSLFMSYYPVLIHLEGKKVVVVGGGTVAERKIETLLEYGAVVQVVSRDLTPRLLKYSEEGTIDFLGQEFHEDCLDKAFMVIAATDDPPFNHRVSEKAKQRGLLVNAVDQPSDCNFIVPSILRRGDLLIAVSTSGKSPALAKKVRETLEEIFGSEYEPLLILMGRLREEIRSQRLSQDENRRIFHKLVNSPILEAIAKKDWNEVRMILNGIIPWRLSSKDVINYLKVE
ncbi:MAG: bifunctional precorrin-2 dehydrogenase/sirohydrochlorin ferrochelatase [Deltaproteobacteria bacterium]|nr:MAG: bifunctional precorrin-2 dehydrogenase/sirohydrochlorin ferrochelatase [Deltaproteobacteria bacterium]